MYSRVLLQVILISYPITGYFEAKLRRILYNLSDPQDDHHLLKQREKSVALLAISAVHEASVLLSVWR